MNRELPGRRGRASKAVRKIGGGSTWNRIFRQHLEGVQAAETFILLNGFKRCRCARQLQIRIVPFSSLGQEEVGAILYLLRVSNDKTLSILEQARFLTELKQARGMSLAEIAESLSRSKAWVSMRLTLVAQMSPSVRDKLLGGAFPVCAYIPL